MSAVEVEELTALGEWLTSFPQLEQFTSNKENNSSLFDNEEDYISNSDIKRYDFFLY